MSSKDTLSSQSDLDTAPSFLACLQNKSHGQCRFVRGVSGSQLSTIIEKIVGINQASNLDRTVPGHVLTFVNEHHQHSLPKSISSKDIHFRRGEQKTTFHRDPNPSSSRDQEAAGPNLIHAKLQTSVETFANKLRVDSNKLGTLLSEVGYMSKPKNLSEERTLWVRISFAGHSDTIEDQALNTEGDTTTMESKKEQVQLAIAQNSDKFWFQDTMYSLGDEGSRAEEVDLMTFNKQLKPNNTGKRDLIQQAGAAGKGQDSLTQKSTSFSWSKKKYSVWLQYPKSSGIPFEFVSALTGQQLYSKIAATYTKGSQHLQQRQLRASAIQHILPKSFNIDEIYYLRLDKEDEADGSTLYLEMVDEKANGTKVFSVGPVAPAKLLHYLEVQGSTPKQAIKGVFTHGISWLQISPLGSHLSPSEKLTQGNTCGSYKDRKEQICRLLDQGDKFYFSNLVDANVKGTETDANVDSKDPINKRLPKQSSASTQEWPSLQDEQGSAAQPSLSSPSIVDSPVPLPQPIATAWRSSAGLSAVKIAPPTNLLPPIIDAKARASSHMMAEKCNADCVAVNPKLYGICIDDTSNGITAYSANESGVSVHSQLFKQYGKGKDKSMVDKMVTISMPGYSLPTKFKSEDIHLLKLDGRTTANDSVLHVELVQESKDGDGRTLKVGFTTPGGVFGLSRPLLSKIRKSGKQGVDTQSGYRIPWMRVSLAGSHLSPLEDMMQESASCTKKKTVTQLCELMEKDLENFYFHGQAKQHFPPSSATNNQNEDTAG